MYYNVNPIRE